MKIEITKNLVEKDVLVLGFFDAQKDTYENLSRELSMDIKTAIAEGIFDASFGKEYYTYSKDLKFKSIMFLGLGKKGSFNAEKLRRAMSIIIGYVKARRYSSFFTNIFAISDIEVTKAGMAISEGLILSEYSFDKYLSKKLSDGKGNQKNKDKTEISAFIQSTADLSKGIMQGRIIAEATNYVKDLVNEPAVVVTPEYLEKEAKALASKNVSVKVLNKPEMKKFGLNALLAVGSGSDHDPKLILLQYDGAGKGKERYTAIVGKGVTFDSGGYDIKPAGKFADMKCDMAAGAAVLGTIKAASALGLKKNIIGVIPACENLINGAAYKPGDIIKAYNGKTIEVLNTDAEGRLILADALSYVEKNYSPETIIDLATLTGACIIALGYYFAAVYSNNSLLSKDLSDAGSASSDRVWSMPFDEDYHDLMDGDISDLKNMSKWTDGRPAGSITAAVFLSKFVDLEKTKWAHIDIAGTAFLPEERYYHQKYASGAGVRLLSYYFMR